MTDYTRRFLKHDGALPWAPTPERYGSFIQYRRSTGALVAEVALRVVLLVLFAVTSPVRLVRRALLRADIERLRAAMKAARREHPFYKFSGDRLRAEAWVNEL